MSGELVFLALAVKVDHLPDRLAQLSVLERAVIRCGRFKLVDWRRSNTFGPPFEYEHTRFALRALEYLTDDLIGQVNVVEDISEFFDEANTQTNPKDASRITRGAGGLPIRDSHIYYGSVICRQANSSIFRMCIS